MTLQLFLTGLVFVVLAIVAGVLDYDSSWGVFVWKIIWILLVIVAAIFWLVAIWSITPASSGGYP